MLAAAFETSTRTPSVAVSAGGLVLTRSLAGDRPHASDLLPALNEVLADVEDAIGVPVPALARGLDLIVVGTGPGSLTGLRVAAATAYGLARGSGARLVGIPSGEILCWRELVPGEEAVVVLDIRQGDFSFTHLRRVADDVEVLTAPRAATPGEWLPLARAADEACRARGARLRLFGEAPLAEREDLPADLRERIEFERPPCASAAIDLGLRRLAARGSEALHDGVSRDIEPLYLRSFAAKRSTRVGG